MVIKQNTRALLYLLPGQKIIDAIDLEKTFEFCRFHLYELGSTLRDFLMKNTVIDRHRNALGLINKFRHRYDF